MSQVSTPVSAAHQQPSPLFATPASVSKDPRDPALTFPTLIQKLKEILGEHTLTDENVPRLMETMSRFDQQMHQAEWKKYAIPGGHGMAYTRNGVDEFNNLANLLILVWNPGKGSKIHDHSDSHCVMKILKGELVETLYEYPDGKPLTVRRERKLKEGDVGYMSDNLGVHRMINGSNTDVAISLHLYSPRVESCFVFEEEDGQSEKLFMSNLYSKDGVLNHPPTP